MWTAIRVLLVANVGGVVFCAAMLLLRQHRLYRLPHIPWNGIDWVGDILCSGMVAALVVAFAAIAVIAPTIR